jgi:hypothetical protein
MNPQQPAASFFVLGGTLKTDAPSYVQRRADTELHDALQAGHFCYVLTSRQMGKSSLMVRMAVRLRAEGAKVPVLDLTALGQNLTVEQWYLGLLGRLGSQIGLEDELEDFWDAHSKLAPLQRWMAALREVALKKLAARIVIFIDEIDATRSLPFSADEFFAGIREFYNERTENPDLERLTFCLLGVATPSDLIQDTRTTPFNIGQRIDLTDFTVAEARVLLPGLNRPEDIGWKLVGRILYWTGGHPYLTQRLCQAVSADANVLDASGVDRICDEIFLSTKARERDDNLLFVRDRMLRGAEDPVALLALYSNVLSGQRIQNEPAHPLFSVLRLSGVVRVEDGRLRVRNRIYERVFNKDFVAANQPLDELQRQRAAERRGRIRVLKVAIPIGAIFLILLSVAVYEWRHALSEHQQKEDLSAKDSKLFADLKTTVNAGLGTASDAAAEIYDASRNDPGLLNTYVKTIRANNQFADAMLTVDPNNLFATNLKTYNLYLDADASLRSKRNNAAAEMQQASQQAERLESNPDLRLRAIAARTYAGSAEIFSRLDRPEAAAAASKKAIALAGQLSSQAPMGDDFTPRTLALTYNMLATGEEHAEHWDGAVQFFQHEIALEQRLYNLYAKENDNRQLNIAHDALEARNRIGRIDLNLGRYDDARQVYQDKSLRIARMLAEQNAGSAEKLRAQRDLWNVQDMLAYLAAAQKKTRRDAVKYYSDAAATGEEIVAADGSTSNRKVLEQDYLSLARVKRLLGNFSGAREEYLKYLARVRKRAAQAPGTASAFDLATAYEAVANFEFHHGDRAEALANYASAAEWLTKSAPNDAGVLEKLAAVERRIGALRSSDQARTHYEKAALASQKSIDLLRKGNGDPYSIQHQLQSSYEELAFSRITLGDRTGAVAALTSSLDAARSATGLADDTQKSHANLLANKRAIEALGSLAWAEVLNNHPRDAVLHAQAAVQRDPAQIWLKVNLLHAYLLANQIDRARETYRDNRGEQVYDDLFELTVLDDFDELRKLGLDRTAMAEFEKLRTTE